MWWKDWERSMKLLLLSIIIESLKIRGLRNLRYLALSVSLRINFLLNLLHLLELLDVIYYMICLVQCSICWEWYTCLKLNLLALLLYWIIVLLKWTLLLLIWRSPHCSRIHFAGIFSKKSLIIKSWERTIFLKLGLLYIL